MPDDKVSETSESEQAAKDAEAAAAAKAAADAAPVTRAEFAQLAQTQEAISASLAALAAARTAPIGQSTIVDIVDPTDEEIAEDLRTGGVTKIKKLVHNAVDRVRKTEIEPFRLNGLQLLATQAQKIARMSNKMPHYDRYKKEIDGMLKELPVEARANPDVYQNAYNMVVGGKVDELVAEATALASRSARDKSGTDVPGSTVTRLENGDKVPTPDELFGIGSEAALEAQGKTPNEFAKRMGHEDWPAYAKFTLDERAGKKEGVKK